MVNTLPWPRMLYNAFKRPYDSCSHVFRNKSCSSNVAPSQLNLGSEASKVVDETLLSELVMSEPPDCSKAAEENADMKESDLIRDKINLDA